jgi:PAS domain S-box-containing protein
MCGGEYDRQELGRSAAPSGRDASWRILDAVCAFVWVLDARGCVLDANRSSLEGAGLRLEDVRGRALWDCPWWSASEEERRKLSSACEIARRGEVVQGEAVVKMTCGERAIDLQIEPLRSAEQRIVQLVLSAVDVTERRRAEADLKASEARRRMASEVARVATFEWDIVNDAYRWSPELEALYGLAPGTFEGTYAAWAKRLHPDDLPTTEAAIRVAFATGSLRTEWRAVWPTGEVRWIEARAIVVHDASGQPQRMLGANFDVTERRELRDALEAVAHRQRAMFEQAAVGMAEVAPDGRMLHSNARLRELLGYTDAELRECTYRDLTHPDDMDGSVAKFERSLAGESESFSFEKRYVRKDGSSFWARVTSALVRTPAGHPDHFVSVVEDIDAQKKAAEQRDDRLRFAEQFVAILGHDLRNPLHAITIAASFLRNESRGQSKPAARILASAGRIENMVTQLLDLTRARIGGGIAVERRPAVLDDIVANVVDELAHTHPGREIRCSFGLPVHGEWDGERLGQVVSNLVANALQHGAPSAPVDVRLATRGASAVLEVHNSGPAIPPDLRAALFEPYRRGPAKGRKVRGLGLGLYITRQIVLAHGGDVAVKSSEGGTTFTVTLPRRSEAPGDDVQAPLQ